jgi:hypothetical protein
MAALRRVGSPLTRLFLFFTLVAFAAPLLRKGSYASRRLSENFTLRRFAPEPAGLSAMIFGKFSQMARSMLAAHCSTAVGWNLPGGRHETATTSRVGVCICCDSCGISMDYFGGSSTDSLQ